MFLIVHTAAGIVLAAAATQSPAAAFGVGLMSHYVLDFVPHGDESAGTWVRRDGHEIRRYAFLAAVDFSLVALLFLLVAYRHGWSWPAALAVAGAVLPDVAWGLEMALGRQFFGLHTKWHLAIHTFILRRFNFRLPLWLGLTFQTALAAALWYSLYV